MATEIPIDLSKPHIQRALELVNELREICAMHNLPKTLILGGVAVDADEFRKYILQRSWGIHMEKGEVDILTKEDSERVANKMIEILDWIPHEMLSRFYTMCNNIENSINRG